LCATAPRAICSSNRTWSRSSATGNNIGGSLQAFQNLGGLTLVNNRMHGNLQCKESVPAPVGGGNRSPSKEDQCARL
jgi:hypothetical protein